MNELTPKQEKFIQNVVSGMSQRQAYKDAYDAANMSDETIDKEACLLFNSPKISERYQELIEELKNKAIMTATERMIWLSEVIKDIQREEIYVRNSDGEEILMGIKNADLNTKIKALDTLNKMDGQYKTILDGNVGITKLEDVL